ncbi:MAG: hypothetical protein PHE70_06035 [Tepidanaerobacteraceae bacterium]|nr:hypothetical protein [Tepidanaerobacteraceae bacterium]
MYQKNTLEKLKNFFYNFIKKNKGQQKDMVEVSLPGLYIKVKRNINLKTPHELSVIIPRAQMSKKCLNESCSKYEYELIYSSITIVHAPRHPLAEPSQDIAKNI